MIVTVVGEGNRKELLYGYHELVGNPKKYDVNEEQINLIRDCTSDRIQAVIDLIIKTSKQL